MTEKRPPCADHRLDFASIHARSGADVIAEARAVCASCPLLLPCLDYLETTEPAGLAGGMLPAQRARWRRRDGISEPRALEFHEVSEAAELAGPFLDDLPSRVRHAPFAMPLVEVVRRLTEAGYTAEEIADRLNEFHANARSVRHLRATHMTDGVTARRRAFQHQRRPEYVERSVIEQWAREQGIEIKHVRNALSSKLVGAYHRAHAETAESSGVG